MLYDGTESPSFYDPSHDYNDYGDMSRVKTEYERIEKLFNETSPEEREETIDRPAAGALTKADGKTHQGGAAAPNESLAATASPIPATAQEEPSAVREIDYDRDEYDLEGDRSLVRFKNDDGTFDYILYEGDAWGVTRIDKETFDRMRNEFYGITPTAEAPREHIAESGGGAGGGE